jgi:hypothetical protein
MTPTGPIPIERQIAELRRELAMRGRVYPRFVQTGRMTQDEADKYAATMRAALATLEGVRDERQAKVAPGLF